jgi:hypothetical protein
VVSALDSRPGDPGSILSFTPVRDIPGQDVNSQVPRPTKPFIPPGSINWYQLRLGLTSSVWLQGWRMARLAAGGGCGGANPSSATVCAAPCVVLICGLPTCNAVVGRDLSLSVAIKTETFNPTRLLSGGR